MFERDGWNLRLCLCLCCVCWLRLGVSLTIRVSQLFCVFVKMVCVLKPTGPKTIQNPQATHQNHPQKPPNPPKHPAGWLWGVLGWFCHVFVVFWGGLGGLGGFGDPVGFNRCACLVLLGELLNRKQSGLEVRPPHKGDMFTDFRM